MVFAVRGAALVDENSREAISGAAVSVVEELIRRNNIHMRRIVSIVFSATGDLTAYNPATALRSEQGYNEIPLFCAAEPAITGSAERVIRVLLTYKKMMKPGKIKPVYLNGAEALRPDLTDG